MFISISLQHFKRISGNEMWKNICFFYYFRKKSKTIKTKIFISAVAFILKLFYCGLYAGELFLLHCAAIEMCTKYVKQILIS